MEEIPSPPQGIDRIVRIPADSLTLDGQVVIPSSTDGLVIFAHPSSAGRNSRRDQYMARMLRSGGLSTMLVNLLSREEEIAEVPARDLRSDINLLAERLNAVTQWAIEQPELEGKRLGYLASSTGAAAAVLAAIQHPDEVFAIAAHGGRPDLAAEALPELRAYTLLIVGSKDEQTLERNQRAYELLRVEKDLRVIPDANLLFEEPGKLEEATILAIAWFRRYLLSAETSLP